MNNFVKLCKILDSLGMYSLSDNIFIKVAEKDKDILDKRIFIPYEVRKVAEEAYKKRLGDIKFGTPKEHEIARQLSTRTYLEISEILKIHEYTVDKRYSHSKSKNNPTYWEYQLYAGDEGRRWASDIIKIYLPKKWKRN